MLFRSVGADVEFETAVLAEYAVALLDLANDDVAINTLLGLTARLISHLLFLH